MPRPAPAASGAEAHSQTTSVASISPSAPGGIDTLHFMPTLRLARSSPWPPMLTAVRLPETVTGFRGVRYPKEDAAYERFARLMEEAR